MQNNLTVAQAQALPRVDDRLQLEAQVACAVEIEKTIHELYQVVVFSKLSFREKRRLFAGLAHLATHLAEQTTHIAAEMGGRMC
jgi:hypothetical protein